MSYLAPWICLYQIIAIKYLPSPMTYQLELWYAAASTYTYRITYFSDNLLATGNATPTNTKDDYITIISSRDGDKLNINNFVEKEEVNNSTQQKKYLLQ